MFLSCSYNPAALQQKAVPMIYIKTETALMAPEQFVSLIEGKWYRILLIDFQISIKNNIQNCWKCYSFINLGEN